MDGVLKPGDAVIAVDEYGVRHNALVTIYHDGGMERPNMACNVVYVSADPSKHDPYGQQVERLSSLSAKSETTAPSGRYYELLK